MFKCTSISITGNNVPRAVFLLKDRNLKGWKSFQLTLTCQFWASSPKMSPVVISSLIAYHLPISQTNEFANIFFNYCLQPWSPTANCDRLHFCNPLPVWIILFVSSWTDMRQTYSFLQFLLFEEQKLHKARISVYSLMLLRPWVGLLLHFIGSWAPLMPYLILRKFLFPNWHWRRDSSLCYSWKSYRVSGMDGPCPPIATGVFYPHCNYSNPSLTFLESLMSSVRICW